MRFLGRLFGRFVRWLSRGGRSTSSHRPPVRSATQIAPEHRAVAAPTTQQPSRQASAPRTPQTDNREGRDASDNEAVVRDLCGLIRTPMDTGTRKEIKRIGEYLGARGGRGRMEAVLRQVSSHAINNGLSGAAKHVEELWRNIETWRGPSELGEQERGPQGPAVCGRCGVTLLVDTEVDRNYPQGGRSLRGAGTGDQAMDYLAQKRRDMDAVCVTCSDCGKIFCVACMERLGKRHPYSGGLACLDCNGRMSAFRGTSPLVTGRDREAKARVRVTSAKTLYDGPAPCGLCDKMMNTDLSFNQKQALVCRTCGLSICWAHDQAALRSAPCPRCNAASLWEFRGAAYEDS
jgi:hypothetical protein